jgi:hypothetical protein
MASKQVMLTLTAALCVAACSVLPPRGASPLIAPYAERRVWAVAPLRNESGTLQVDGAALADHLARQLENAEKIDVLPVNRVLAAMESLRMAEITSPAEALKVLAVLQCDGLIVGTVSTYDPYDPPKLGMAIELYTSPRFEERHITDLRALTSAGTERESPRSARPRQPVQVVSAFFDAADPDVRRKIARYATDRRVQKDPMFVFQKNPEEPERMYRISMDLYSEFVSYVMSWRLLRAETIRLAPPPTTQPARR